MWDLLQWAGHERSVSDASFAMHDVCQVYTGPRIQYAQTCVVPFAPTVTGLSTQIMMTTQMTLFPFSSILMPTTTINNTQTTMQQRFSSQVIDHQCTSKNFSAPLMNHSSVHVHQCQINAKSSQCSRHNAQLNWLQHWVVINWSNLIVNLSIHPWTHRRLALKSSIPK